LTYAIEKFRGVDPSIAHITMKTVVRSRLADLGVRYLE
jgi:predicted ribonuclease YlaK